MLDDTAVLARRVALTPLRLVGEAARGCGRRCHARCEGRRVHHRPESLVIDGGTLIGDGS
jgi:hypothetical protein